MRAFYLSIAPGAGPLRWAKSIICGSGGRTEIAQKVPILLERDNASARLISIRSASERAASHGRRSLIKSHLRFCVRFQRMGGYLAKSANMMRHEANKPVSPAPGIFSPLRYAVFRRIWTASLLSNLGLLVLGVGAAWSMTKISSSTSMVALVQTSLMLPVALVSTPAGAIADMFDRRIVGLVALSIALAGSISLSVLAWLGVMTPALLLVSCFIIGSGMALFGPAWQASVSEQVPAEALPSAVALNGISYNIARSFGPAIGGVIVASAGAVAAFITNALLYLPLLIVLFFWRRLKEPSRLPPERLARAVVSGVRYIVHSPPIRIVLGRTLVYRNCRRFSLSAHADRRARPVARWRSNIRRYAGGVWNGCSDRST